MISVKNSRRHIQASEEGQMPTRNYSTLDIQTIDTRLAYRWKSNEPKLGSRYMKDGWCSMVIPEAAVRRDYGAGLRSLMDGMEGMWWG
jgi:hypothetical protein